MLEISESTRFKKDVKRACRRGYDISKLIEIVSLLSEEKDLPERTRPHMLVGEFKGILECHITPDWLLMYEVTKTKVYLYRTGTHADLFE